MNRLTKQQKIIQTRFWNCLVSMNFKLSCKTEQNAKKKIKLIKKIIIVCFSFFVATGE